MTLIVKNGFICGDYVTMDDVFRDLPRIREELLEQARLYSAQCIVNRATVAHDIARYDNTGPTSESFARDAVNVIRKDIHNAAARMAYTKYDTGFTVSFAKARSGEIVGLATTNNKRMYSHLLRTVGGVDYSYDDLSSDDRLSLDERSHRKEIWGEIFGVDGDLSWEHTMLSVSIIKQYTMPIPNTFANVIIPDIDTRLIWAAKDITDIKVAGKYGFNVQEFEDFLTRQPECEKLLSDYREQTFTQTCDELKGVLVDDITLVKLFEEK